MTTEPATIAPEGEDMARQTAQAKMLRGARDELAARALALAEKKDRKGLQRMGLPAPRIKELITGQPFTSEDMAYLLGVTVQALRLWLATPKITPSGHQLHREMPKTAKLLLARILADKPKKTTVA